MDKRAELRKYYQDEALKITGDRQYSERSAQIQDLNNNVVGSIGVLLQYLDGKTTKTEVINQLESISTPDVEKVVTAVSKLDANILANKLDLKPVIDSLNGLKREMSLVPKTLPKFEQKDAIKVTNLAEIKLDTSAVEKAIKALDLKVDVKAPVINTENIDIEPLRKELLNVVKYLKELKPQETVKISNLADISPTDLTKVEKKLDESNKHLKEIAEKKFGGGGGGGGNGTPYIDGNGKLVNPILNNGSIPVYIGASDPTAGNNPSFDADIAITTNSITITEVETIGTDDYQYVTTIDKTDPLNLHITGSSWSKV